MGQGKIVYIAPYGDEYDPSCPKRVNCFSMVPCCCHETFTIAGVNIKELKKIENALAHGFVNHWLDFV